MAKKKEEKELEKISQKPFFFMSSPASYVTRSL